MKRAKNGQVYKGGAVERISANPTKLFSVDSSDLKSMSFKFGNDIFITFEMPRVSYILKVQAQKTKFLLFRPSVIRGPWAEVLHSVVQIWAGRRRRVVIVATFNDQRYIYYTQIQVRLFSWLE